MVIFTMVKPPLTQNVNCEWFKSKDAKSFRSLFYESECGVFFFFLSPPFSFIGSSAYELFSLIYILVGQVWYLKIRLCFLLLAPAKKATFAPDYVLKETSAYKGLYLKQLKFTK